ncbi:MAG: PP2C family protein-serine/threonine phosphatase, partial [Candidatus Riflebacteria bacterium]
GVSSSILTAMVKALIFRFSQRPQDLSLIMRDLSHMIFDLLHHRKLMTFCAIIIEQNTGNYMLTNAGHPFPMICNPNGSTRTIEHNSLPLGVSKKRSNYPATSGTIEPGEVLILYTDGIAEATNSEGQMFGFDRVRNIVGENCHQSGKAIKEELLNQFWAHYTEKHLDDDLTFIILKRLSDHA